MLPVPRAARLVSWGNAALAGRVSPDTAADRVVGCDEPHRVAGLPGESAPVSLPLALARLRSGGARGLRLALPVAGDVSGVPGPSGFRSLAVEAGQAAVTVGVPALGLVPTVEIPLTGEPGPGAGRLPAPTARVLWRVLPVDPEAPAGAPSLAEAERALRETLLEATRALVAMDVARWRPELAEDLQRLREDRDMQDALAPGYPARAASVLALARKVSGIAVLAGQQPGAAVSAGEMARRTAVLRDLERVCREAQVAAYNAVLEPARG